MVSTKGRLFRMLKGLCQIAHEDDLEVLVLDTRVINPRTPRHDSDTIAEYTIRVRCQKVASTESDTGLIQDSDKAKGG